MQGIFYAREMVDERGGDSCRNSRWDVTKVATAYLSIKLRRLCNHIAVCELAIRAKALNGRYVIVIVGVEAL